MTMLQKCLGINEKKKKIRKYFTQIFTAAILLKIKEGKTEMQSFTYRGTKEFSNSNECHLPEIGYFDLNFKGVVL